MVILERRYGPRRLRDDDDDDDAREGIRQIWHVAPRRLSVWLCAKFSLNFKYLVYSHSEGSTFVSKVRLMTSCELASGSAFFVTRASPRGNVPLLYGKRSTVISRRRPTNFKMLVSQSMSAVLRQSV